MTALKLAASKAAHLVAETVAKLEYAMVAMMAATMDDHQTVSLTAFL